MPEIYGELLVAKFAHGFQVRQAGIGFSADERIGLELATIDQRRGDDSRYRTQVHLSPQQIDQRWPRAAVGHLSHFHAELLEYQHLDQMSKRADAGMPDLDDLAWLFHPAQ